MKIHLGIDSTDSPNGGCTTFTMVRIIDALYEFDHDMYFIGYPKLIRLNPNIPMKTRGNAALSLSFQCSDTTDLNEIKRIVIEIVNEDYTKYHDGSEKKPGIAVLIGDIKWNLLYQSALRKVITKESVLNAYPDIWLYPEDGNGIIGASVACTTNLPYDHTYEFITYRLPRNYNQKRNVDLNILKKIDEDKFDVFSSIDTKNNRELIAPSGPDPVFCGIRGENPLSLIPYFNLLKIEENLESGCIFITNQGTNDHLMYPQMELDEYSTFSSSVVIHSEPNNIEGKHVNFKVRLDEHIIDVMVFRPTGALRSLARNLIIGDEIYLGGNIKLYEGKITVSAEYISVLSLMKDISIPPQKCENGHTMTKLGTFKGYKCQICGAIKLKQAYSIAKRLLFEGQMGYADLTAQRHLTRPLNRLHIRNDQSSVMELLRYLDFRVLF